MKQSNYYQSFNYVKFLSLYTQLARYFLPHYLFRPYRKSVSTIGHLEFNASRRQRRREALYDSIFNILLDGYIELTGLELSPSTGQMLFFLRQFARSFDDYFEKHLAWGDSLEFRAILNEPVVNERQVLLQNFIELHTSSDPMFSYLRELFESHYIEFLETFNKAKESPDFEEVLKVIEFDSGFWLEAMMQSVALFNQHNLNIETRQNFNTLGIAGKLGDEIVDLKRDIHTNNPNILLSLLAERPNELEAVQLAITNETKLNKSWWDQNCPTTYLGYFELIEQYYDQITSSKLKLACDLMILPSLIGHDYETYSNQWVTDFSDLRLGIREKATHFMSKQIGKFGTSIWKKAQARMAIFARKRFFNSMQPLASVQDKALSRIIKSNANSWFGRKYNFKNISAIQDYQNTVPIQSYKNMEGFIERIAEGEPKVLTCESVDFLQLTSGTTSGRQKLLPMTRRTRRKISYSTLTSLGLIQEQKVKLGLGMIIIGKPDGKTNGGIPYGTVSTGYTRNARGLWHWLSAVPFDVSLVDDPDARMYLHWRFALLEDKLDFISAIYMPTLILYAQTLFRYTDDLISDIYEGKITPKIKLASGLRILLEERLQPFPQRATMLESIASQYGGLTPKNVWPQMKWIITVYGPTQQAYETHLKEWFSPKAIWGAPYLAAEGLIGVPTQQNSYSHFPAINVSFFEFIPEPNWFDDSPPTCLISDLEIGKKYEIVLTG